MQFIDFQYRGKHINVLRCVLRVPLHTAGGFYRPASFWTWYTSKGWWGWFSKYNQSSIFKTGNFVTLISKEVKIKDHSGAYMNRPQVSLKMLLKAFSLQHYPIRTDYLLKKEIQCPNIWEMMLKLLENCSSFASGI